MGARRRPSRCGPRCRPPVGWSAVWANSSSLGSPWVWASRQCSSEVPACARTVSHPKLVLCPLGLVNASASLGPALAPLLLTPLMIVAGGEQASSHSAVWPLLVLVRAAIYRTPQQSAEAAPRIAGPAVWLTLQRRRSTWGLLGFAGTVYITWLYVTWLPGYLVGRWGLPPEKAALWSAAPQLAGPSGQLEWVGGQLPGRNALPPQHPGSNRGPVSRQRLPAWPGKSERVPTPAFTAIKPETATKEHWNRRSGQSAPVHVGNHG